MLEKNFFFAKNVTGKCQTVKSRGGQGSSCVLPPLSPPMHTTISIMYIATHAAATCTS